MPLKTELPFEAYIGLGSNLGNRESYLLQAIRMLNDHRCIEVIRCSHIYETDPVGYLEQPAFLNMVVAVRTSLSAERLFAYMLQAEQRLERVRDIRWGPRTIDMDLLLYDHLNVATPELTIPHPRMFERAFVMIPLADVLASERLEGMESISALLEKLDGKEGVRLWKTINWPRESELFAN